MIISFSNYITCLIESFPCLGLCPTHDLPHQHPLGDKVRSLKSFLICCLHTILALSLATLSLETTHTPGISSYCPILKHSLGGFFMPLFICLNFLPCLETKLKCHFLSKNSHNQISTCTLHRAVLVFLMFLIISDRSLGLHFSHPIFKSISPTKGTHLKFQARDIS